MASIQRLLLAPATLLIFDNLEAVHSSQANLAHLLASQAHHCTNERISLATHTGSCSILFHIFSNPPYLCLIVSRHSLVNASFHNHVSISSGLVTPLAIPDAVFAKEPGAFTNIVGSVGKSAPNHHKFLFRKSFVWSLVIVGIFCT